MAQLPPAERDARRLGAVANIVDLDLLRGVRADLVHRALRHLRLERIPPLHVARLQGEKEAKAAWGVVLAGSVLHGAFADPGDALAVARLGFRQAACALGPSLPGAASVGARWVDGGCRLPGDTSWVFPSKKVEAQTLTALSAAEPPAAAPADDISDPGEEPTVELSPEPSPSHSWSIVALEEGAVLGLLDPRTLGDLLSEAAQDELRVKVRALSSLPIFAPKSPGAPPYLGFARLEALAASAEIMRLPAGATLVQRGAQADALFFLLAGEASVLVRVSSDERVSLRRRVEAGATRFRDPDVVRGLPALVPLLGAVAPLDADAQCLERTRPGGRIVIPRTLPSDSGPGWRQPSLDQPTSRAAPSIETTAAGSRLARAKIKAKGRGKANHAAFGSDAVVERAVVDLLASSRQKAHAGARHLGGEAKAAADAAMASVRALKTGKQRWEWRDLPVLKGLQADLAQLMRDINASSELVRAGDAPIAPRRKLLVPRAAPDLPAPPPEGDLDVEMARLGPGSSFGLGAAAQPEPDDDDDKNKKDRGTDATETTGDVMVRAEYGSTRTETVVATTDVVLLSLRSFALQQALSAAERSEVAARARRAEEHLRPSAIASRLEISASWDAARWRWATEKGLTGRVREPGASLSLPL